MVALSLGIFIFAAVLLLGELLDSGARWRKDEELLPGRSRKLQRRRARRFRQLRSWYHRRHGKP